MSAHVPDQRPSQTPATVITIEGRRTRTWHDGRLVEVTTTDGSRFIVDQDSAGVTVDVLAPVEQPACTCGGQS